MKKAILILSILFISFNTQAQWFFGKTVKGNGNVITKTRNTNDYDQVHVSGFFDVILVKGQEGNIQIKAESNLMEYIITEVNGNELVIKLKNGTSINTKKGIYITVPFKDLDEISLSGSGDVVGKDIISGSELDIKLSGSGDITLTGKNEYLESSITGSGDFVAKGLSSDKVQINITGSGDASVYANLKIDAKVVGSGDIIFYGNPEIENTKIIGSGDITGR